MLASKHADLHCFLQGKLSRERSFSREGWEVTKTDFLCWILLLETKPVGKDDLWYSLSQVLSAGVEM